MHLSRIRENRARPLEIFQHQRRKWKFFRFCKIRELNIDFSLRSVLDAETITQRLQKITFSTVEVL